jgi:aminoglycoside phosphotransferase (APT) family kinase protein
VAAELGGLLAALHAVPIERVAGLAPVDLEPLTLWRDGTAATWTMVANRVPPAQRRAVERWLAAPPPGAGPTRVFSHQDLGIEHVLVDPVTSTVCGVIDWTDAAVGDPAYDLGLILRDLGPGGLDAALRAYGPVDAGLGARAAFYARCSLVEDLAHAVETGRRVYAEKSLAAIPALFVPGPPPGPCSPKPT